VTSGHDRLLSKNRKNSRQRNACLRSQTDRDAVVDPDGRVIGVQGLRVVDASIMPSIPRGNTNIPTIMVAEKMADMILDA